MSLINCCSHAKTSLERRIFNEFRNTKEAYSLPSINTLKRVEDVIVDVCDIDSNVSFYYVTNEKKRIFVEFGLNSQYPFRPPFKVNIEGAAYTGGFELSIEQQRYFSKVLGKKCLHCESCMNYRNWKPMFGMLKIVNEYIETCNIINNYDNFKMVIKKNYLSKLPQELYINIFHFIVFTNNNYDESVKHIIKYLD